MKYLRLLLVRDAALLARLFHFEFLHMCCGYCLTGIRTPVKPAPFYGMIVSGVVDDSATCQNVLEIPSSQ
jgi:hypothetical protein